MLRLMLMLAALVAAPSPDPAWTSPNRGDGTVTVGGRGVTPVFGVPSGSISPRPKPRPDLTLNQRLNHLAGMVTPHVSIYSLSWSGRAAAYNAGVEFEAASTAEAADHDRCLIRQPGQSWNTPSTGTRWCGSPATPTTPPTSCLEQTGGSDPDGAADMVELMKSLGLTHTYMPGGYLIEGGGGSSLLASSTSRPPPTSTPRPATWPPSPRCWWTPPRGRGRCSSTACRPTRLASCST